MRMGLCHTPVRENRQTCKTGSSNYDFYSGARARCGPNLPIRVCYAVSRAVAAHLSTRHARCPESHAVGPSGCASLGSSIPRPSNADGDASTIEIRLHLPRDCKRGEQAPSRSIAALASLRIPHSLAYGSFMSWRRAHPTHSYFSVGGHGFGRVRQPRGAKALPVDLQVVTRCLVAQMLLDDTRRDADHVLSFPVLDQVECLQQRQRHHGVVRGGNAWRISGWCASSSHADM